MSKLLQFLGLSVIFLGLALTGAIQYYQRRATEDLYLWQMEVEAKSLRSYDRILKDSALGQEEKMARISNLTRVQTAALADQMSLAYEAHHRALPPVWKELSPKRVKDLMKSGQ